MQQLYHDISELVMGNNITYVIDDRNTFLQTEYKVMLGQFHAGIVKCMKMRFNGKMQLFYETESLQCLSSLANENDEKKVISLIFSLLEEVLNIKNNGFLRCESIDISLSHIFFESETSRVKLIYVPTGIRLFPSYNEFERSLRNELLEITEHSKVFDSEQMIKLRNGFASANISLESLLSQLKSNNSDKPPTHEKSGVAGDFSQVRSQKSKYIPRLHLTLINASEKFEIVVDKDNFFIGRNPETSDGLITFNKAIGRRHCVICRNGDGYTISDLDSANGTFVNTADLPPFTPYPVKNGDIVRLADSYFRAEIR